MEQYADGQWKHASKYNNPKDCRRNGGSWVEFSNYIKLLPEYDTEDKCKKASTAEVPLIWAIPYRSDLIDRLDKDQKKWKQCLVQPRSPDCRQAPYSRSNHLGNAEGVVPLFYDWVLPYIPQSKAKPEHHYNCVLRIRYARLAWLVIVGKRKFSVSILRRKQPYSFHKY